MSLKIWLPFTENKNNQGVVNLYPSSEQLAQATAGKIGKCYGGGVIYNTNQSIIGNKWTIAMWVKTSSWGTYNDILACKNIDSSNHCQFYFSVIGGNTLNIGVNTGYSSLTYSYTFATDTWYHLAATYNGTTCVLYINGNSVKEGNITNSAFTDCTNIGIGCRSSNTTGTSAESLNTTRFFNDVRIYDNALTPREIKNISMGLSLHYPLSDRYNSSNLIYNGYGEYGSDGWAGATVSTSDLPSDSSVKAVFTNGTTTEKIPVNAKDNMFTVSCYIKSGGGTSGYVYPSILPYDIDNKFISNVNCMDGFSTTWQTTLAQPLKKGDTVVYCSDLSAWNTATNNYYYFLAIFGYKDSLGNVYPDFTYTADVPTFGTYSDKSGINKTNNTITLLSAYTGEPRPAGTKVCQATAGSTYYYPFGGIDLSSIQSWTYKTATFYFKDRNRLRYAKYIQWYNYPGAKYAGVKITDDSWKTTTVFDVSGNQHNAIQNNIAFNSNSPVNNGCYIFSGANSSIRTTANTQHIGTGDFTISAWIYIESSNKSYQPVISNKTTAANSVGCAIYYNHNQNKFLWSTADGSNSTEIWTSNTFTNIYNKWIHIVMVRNSSDAKKGYFYIDGVRQELASVPAIRNISTTHELVIGALYSDHADYRWTGKISDVRMYSTALDEDAIKKLYNMGGDAS